MIKNLEWLILRIISGMLEHRERIFTKFPSKMELTRMLKIKETKVENNDCVIHFEEWPVEKWWLIDVWIRIKGWPYELRCDYLGLFAVVKRRGWI